MRPAAIKRRGGRAFSLRLPPELVDRIDERLAELRSAGFPMNRTDVARLYLARALDAFVCDARGVLSAKKPPT